MRLLIPSTGTPVSLTDLLRASLPVGDVAGFERQVCAWTGAPWCRLVNSGTTALYVLLKAMRRLRPGREEVLLPAYTAPSLILPIRKAGLRPVLCDVSLETFLADMSGARVSGRTLAVLMIPMFGLPCDEGEARRVAEGCGAFLVEDAASAMGSRWNGRMGGSGGDAGFLSFNRGKNLSTVSGGVVLAGREEVQQAVNDEVGALPSVPLSGKVQVMGKALALALAVRPFWYTALHRGISRFKYTALHTDFASCRYTAFQARLGMRLLGRAETFLTPRHKNGILWAGALSGVEGITLPHLPAGARVVFNQFPILLRDAGTRDAAHRAVLATGVEATTLYPGPIHRLIGDLCYADEPDPFPNATAMARRLLLLPTHALVPEARLREAAEAVKKVVRREV